LKYIKGVIINIRKSELFETRLDQTITAENARKVRRFKPNQILQKGGILYTGDSKAITSKRTA